MTAVLLMFSTCDIQKKGMYINPKNAVNEGSSLVEKF